MNLFAGLEHVVQQDVLLSPYNSLRIGGNAAYFAVPTSHSELQAVVQQARAANLSVRVLGHGANVVIPSSGWAGLVIQLSAPEFTGVAVNGNRMTAGGGANLAHFVSLAAREGFKGPEQLVGIPGTIGGALHVNTSTNGGNIGAWVKQATVLTAAGDVLIREHHEMNFSYRQSSLNELAIVAAEFEFEREASEQVLRRMQKLWIVRKAKQPMLDEPCAYVFKDHGGSTATQVLTKAGVQGLKSGHVEVSDRDPNFFVARQGATSSDFLDLVQKTKQQVQDRSGLELELAVDVW
ncbi:MAG: UDP-N-acetylmuramate dehydrogenase [Pirellulaceae bacterium]|nr:UDP-N-acetylmuramate dehydrogenase [Pirellulaceae bacterium]